MLDKPIKGLFRLEAIINLSGEKWMSYLSECQIC